MKNLSFLILTLATLVVLSCSKEELTPAENSKILGGGDISTRSSLSSSITMLGDKFTYPFSVQKLDSINLSLGNTSPLPITHKYVEFTAGTAAEFKDIKEDNRFVTSHYPYDYELLQEGKKLQGYENSLIYPLYAVIPANIDITNYSFVVLEDVHFEPSEILLNKLAYKDHLESIGDEPCEPGASIYPLCQCDKLYTYGSPDWINCILDEGFVDPVVNVTNSQFACSCSNTVVRRPSGCVTYDDTQFTQAQPVKNLQVRGVNQFGFYFITYTDQYGCWESNRTLEWWESMRLKLKFNNEKVAIRSLFIVPGAVFGLTIPVLDVAGYYNILTDERFFPFNAAVNNIPVNYADSPFPFSDERRLYLAVLTLNSMEEYHQYADHYNIQKPSTDGLFSDDIDVLLTNLNGLSGAAPMLDEIDNGIFAPFNQANGYTPIIRAIMGLDQVMGIAPLTINVFGQEVVLDDLDPFLFAFLEQVFTTLANLSAIYAFDVVMNYNEATEPSDQIKRVIYHEFAHVAYYQRLPQNTRNQFWIDNIDYIANNIRLDMNDPDGLAGNEPYGNFNFVGAQRTAINEAWAEHVGRLFADRRYDLEHSNGAQVELNTHKIVLERLVPNPTDSGNSAFRWIPEGLFLDLMDDENVFEPTIMFGGTSVTLIDQVDGYSISELEAIISDNTPETFLELRTNILNSSSASSNSTTFLTLLCDQYGI